MLRRKVNQSLSHSPALRPFFQQYGHAGEHIAGNGCLNRSCVCLPFFIFSEDRSFEQGHQLPVLFLYAHLVNGDAVAEAFFLRDSDNAVTRLQRPEMRDRGFERYGMSALAVAGKGQGAIRKGEADAAKCIMPNPLHISGRRVMSRRE